MIGFRIKKLMIGNSQNVPISEHLKAVGVALLSEWDTLTFLYHHANSLGTAAQIARFVGYDKAEIVSALHKLAVLGLIQRSRVSQGIRFYQFSAPPEPSRHTCLQELMSLAQSRTGRLQLLGHLKVPRPEPQLRRNSGLRLAWKEVDG